VCGCFCVCVSVFASVRALVRLVGRAAPTRFFLLARAWSFLLALHEHLLRYCQCAPFCIWLPRRVCCAWQRAKPVQHARPSEQAREETTPAGKIDVTSKSPVGDISVVTLIRTDTTLDHSQKAEKVCSPRSPPQLASWAPFRADVSRVSVGARRTASDQIARLAPPKPWTLRALLPRPS
jgi:hypothetical protein